MVASTRRERRPQTRSARADRPDQWAAVMTGVYETAFPRIRHVDVGPENVHTVQMGDAWQCSWQRCHDSQFGSAVVSPRPAHCESIALSFTSTRHWRTPPARTAIAEFVCAENLREYDSTSKHVTRSTTAATTARRSSPAMLPTSAAAPALARGQRWPSRPHAAPGNATLPPLSVCCQCLQLRASRASLQPQWHMHNCRGTTLIKACRDSLMSALALSRLGGFDGRSRVRGTKDTASRVTVRRPRPRVWAHAVVMQCSHRYECTWPRCVHFIQ